MDDNSEETSGQVAREALTGLLQQIRSPLAELQRDQSTEQRRNLIEEFMTGIYRLGRLLHQEPSLASSPELLTFLRDGESLLLAAVPSILSYVNTTESKFYAPWVYDEWTRVSIRRSAIEFLRELFCDTTFAEFLPFFNTDDIDKMFPSKEEKGGYLPVEAIPTGIPLSHWWWYPNDPRSAGSAECSK